MRGPRVPSARGPSTPTPPPRPEGSLRRLPRDAASPGGPAQRRGCDRAAGATSSRFHPFLTPLQAGGAGRAAPHRAPHRGHLPEASSSSEGAAAAASSSLPPSPGTSPLPPAAVPLPCGAGAGMERDLLRQVLNYHGPGLLALLRAEQHDNPDFRGLLPPPGALPESPRGGASRSQAVW